MSTLVTLHAAGAEVAGMHGDAWVRLLADQAQRDTLCARVAALHARLGRRIIPCDITGQELPLCVAPPAVRGPRITPAAKAIADSRPLRADELVLLKAAISRCGTITSAAARLDVNHATLTRAISGRPIRGDKRPAMLTAANAVIDEPFTPVVKGRKYA